MNAVVQEAINRQINAELTRVVQYLAMSAWCAARRSAARQVAAPAEPGGVRPRHEAYDFVLARDGT